MPVSIRAKVYVLHFLGICKFYRMRYIIYVVSRLCSAFYRMCRFLESREHIIHTVHCCANNMLTINGSFVFFLRFKFVDSLQGTSKSAREEEKRNDGTTYMYCAGSFSLGARAHTHTHTHTHTPKICRQYVRHACTYIHV